MLKTLQYYFMIHNYFWGKNGTIHFASYLT